MWKQKANWVHFIGVAGKTTGQLAIALSEEGYEVTGSDKEIYEPMKSLLSKKDRIKLFSNFDYKNLIQEDKINPEVKYVPEQVIALGSLPLRNKEILFCRKRGIPIRSFAQYFEENLIVKDNSVVVAGSFGKTTTTAILTWVMRDTNISYMFGGQISGEEISLRLKQKDAVMSIVEGDEYMSARWDKQSKFFRFHPSRLVLTGYAHDHLDIFPTEAEYFANFKKLVEQLPSSAELIINAKYEKLRELSSYANCEVVEYSASEVDWSAYKHNLIGEFNRENLAAAIKTLESIGVEEEKIRRGIASFPGVSRRLEKVSDNLIIDFGSTPGKASSAIQAVKDEFQGRELVVLLEPNIGTRSRETIEAFKKALEPANKVVLLPFANEEVGELSREEFARELGLEQDLEIQSKKDLSKLEGNYANPMFLVLSSGNVDEFYN
ncbi:MAG: Mur ligase family protein [Candidatus Dojkabacteria bacterium]